MKPAKLFLFPQIDLMILRTQVPQLIHDLVIHSVLLILGRLAPFPWGLPLFSGLPIHRHTKELVQNGFHKPLRTTITRFTTLFFPYADP